MNLRHALLPLALALSLPAVANAAQRGFTVQDMAYMDRHSAPTLSPDGRVLVFAKRVVDKDSNKSSTSLWIRNLSTRDVRVTVDLHAGDATATILTNDLTYGYVKENAEYST